MRPACVPQSQMPFSGARSSVFERAGLPLGPPSAAAKMWAARPLDSTWFDDAPRPTVKRLQPGKLQRYPARRAIALFVFGKKSALVLVFNFGVDCSNLDN
jgi:hypothetical protein